MAKSGFGFSLVNIESASAMEKSELATLRAKRLCLCLEYKDPAEDLVKRGGGGCDMGDTWGDSKSEAVSSGGLDGFGVRN